MMECLGEMIWQAQRNRTQPDAAVYFACLQSMNPERQIVTKDTKSTK